MACTATKNGFSKNLICAFVYPQMVLALRFFYGRNTNE